MIKIDMEMPKGCSSCRFFKGCCSPDKFPFVECMLIGKCGNMFEVYDMRPIECPLKECEEDGNV